VVAIQGSDHLVPRSAQALLQALPLASVTRLVFLGGGGSLEYAPGHRSMDSPDFSPEYLETSPPSGSMHRWFPAVVTGSPINVSKRPSSCKNLVGATGFEPVTPRL
jgi:hypothetical protein